MPVPLQRMEAENLIAAVFPDQLACQENLVGDRDVPDHPLVNQTIDDCLTEAMDIDGLIGLLRSIERGQVECIARDLPEPSPLAHAILNARPYAFLDNAPLEERRTQAVYTRRALKSSPDAELGILDAEAIEGVVAEAWPTAVNPDELHDALLLMGVMTEEEMSGYDPAFRETLVQTGRIGRASWPRQSLWVAAERLPMLRAIFPDARVVPELTPARTALGGTWDRPGAIRELVRGRLEVAGPVAARWLAEALLLSEKEIEAAFLALEAEGFVLRGRFHPGVHELEWCDRRLLARIHRLTINRLRAEIQPVSLHEFFRFLLAWQRVDDEHCAEGPEGLLAVLEQLDGYELPLCAWEPEVFLRRVREFDSQWLDRWCLSGRVGWGRLTPPQNHTGRAFAPLRSSPICFFQRESLGAWLALAEPAPVMELAPDPERVLEVLTHSGAQFFTDLVRQSGLLPSQVEQALTELVALGFVTADSFDGVRALLVPSDRRPTFGRPEGKRHRKNVASIEFAGRWSLLRGDPGPDPGSAATREPALEVFARALLRRYGVVFRRLLEREALTASWYELGRVYRRLEARGEIRGGHFVSGVSGEQFGLPEAIGLLRSIRKTPAKGELITLSAADPLNLLGILTPGPRVAALAGNRILFRDGLPIAVLESGQIRKLEEKAEVPDLTTESALTIGRLPVAPAMGFTITAIEPESALTIGRLPVALRPYYG
jgi:ATP-dependent Lhr-like helicase